MQKTKIEWADMVANPIRGKCGHYGTKICGTYCYAERIRKRFNQPEDVSFFTAELDTIRRRKKPATIFIGSMHDVFGEWVFDNWIETILRTCRAAKQHTFLFLTKNPDRYRDFSFPLNCWRGTTITKESAPIYCGPRSFVSIEPLMENIGPLHLAVDGIIIGAMTGPKATKPKLEWVKNIINANTDKPLFIKDNLYRIFSGLSIHRSLPWRLHTKEMK